MQKKNDYHNFFKKTLFKSSILEKEVAELRITEMNERNTKAIEDAYPEIKREIFASTVEELVEKVNAKKNASFELIIVKKSRVFGHHLKMQCKKGFDVQIRLNHKSLEPLVCCVCAKGELDKRGCDKKPEATSQFEVMRKIQDHGNHCMQFLNNF